jgi:chemotaxis protein CheD
MLCDARHHGDPEQIADLSVPRLALYIHPGELHASDTPCTLTTIIGSCVTVCLHDPEAGVGGANHYLLPHRLSSGNDLRYGEIAIPRLVQMTLNLGARRERIEAKVFGGAHIVATPHHGAQRLGSQNVQIAHRLLANERIPIVALDVEGDRARKIVFCTDTGLVRLKRL